MLKKSTPALSRLDTAGFLMWDGPVQESYEALRAYMLLPRGQQPQVAPARFYLARFTRYGLLGLLDRDPLGRAWGQYTVETRQVELVPINAVDTTERMARLYAALYRLTTKIPGGDHDAARSALCTGFYGDAGEGADYPESIGSHHTLR